jgi:cholesterol transport system auxiliary component
MILTIRALLLVPVITLWLAGCTLLPKPEPVALDRYLLEYVPASTQATRADAPVMLVTTPDAQGAYDSPRIAYMQQQYGLRYYTQSRWADTPANMLSPLIADAINATGQIQALYAGPGRVRADLRLDTELTRFHQDFTVQPSVMRITVRAQLVDLRAQRVIASQTFDVREPAQTNDAYGGVQAANRATATLLQQLAQFCLEHLP